MRLEAAIGVAVTLLAGSVIGCAQVAEDPRNHGAPVPVSQSRGATTAIDGEGRRVVLVYLGRGVRTLAVIDVATGETQHIPVPNGGDNPFAHIHSSRDLWYSWFAGNFYEFDPQSLSFTLAIEAPERTCMSFHEDSSGLIWAGGFPAANLVSFDPDTRELVNHGQMNEETWAQYVSTLAADASGWVYGGIGTAGAQVVGVNPASGERRAFVPEADRKPGSGRVFLGTDGQVYASATAAGWGWHVLSNGEARPIEGDEPPVSPAPMRAGSWGAFFREFPDGSRVARMDLESRLLSVQEADGTERQVAFDYQGPLPDVAVLCAGPDGNIYGATGGPSNLFKYEPAKDQLVFYRAASPHLGLKSLRTQGQYVFGGVYSGGGFWTLDTTKPLTLTPVSSIFGREINVAQPEEGAESNPLCIGQFNPNVNIPRNCFAHPDGKHIMISGQPGYGHVGGGLVIYNLETKEVTELTHEQLLRDYSTMAIAALPNGDLLCGTSPRAGHGTTLVHTQASLYILDWQTKQVTWQSEPLEQMASMQSMMAGSDGLYYCIGGDGTLLVFDADKREVVHHASLAEYGGHTTNQAITLGPDGKIYLGLTRAIVRITPGTFEVEKLIEPEGGVQAGLAITGGRLYFASRDHLMSIGL